MSFTKNMTEEKQKQREKIAVVTGSSTGIGYETSLALARNGFITYATMRNLNKAENIKLVATKESLPIRVKQLDVTDDASVKTAIQAISSETGRIDVLVNNAGYGLFGAFEENSMEEIKSQFETNFFGAVRVMQAVIPIMRKQRSGKIINISSMGGRISLPLDSIYHGTKFALEGLSESIQYELEPFGIKIILIEPGVIGSNFMMNLKMAASGQDNNKNKDSPYRQLTNNILEASKQMMQNTTHPSEVAKVILQAIMADNPDFRYAVGKDAAMLLESRKNMSEVEFQNLVKKQCNLQNIQAQ
ncbi:MAG: SDR family oxidoreductase [Nitrososphaeraceae archaeon]